MKFDLENVPKNLSVSVGHNIPSGTKPSEIVKKLDEYVIGQSEAKRILAVASANHKAFVTYNREHKDSVPVKASNVLIAGPSGSGKTLLVESLARELKCPYICVDITNYTPSGYVGGNVAEILDLLLATVEDAQFADQAIIFVDEIDKISSHNTEGDSFKSVQLQAELLKLVEGAEVTVEPASTSRAAYKFKTHNLMWIFGGSFAHYLKSEKLKDDKKTVGFGSSDIKKEKKKFDHETVTKAGFLPEFVGRIGHVVELNELTRDDYKRILTEPVNNPIQLIKILEEYRGIKIDITDQDIDNIVDEAIKLGIGARSLKMLAEKYVFDKMYV